ncbi:Acyl-CoA-binding domain-containing protein 1 [Sesamum alatum]|uniref:Acyl-CoA-binding domain-containing protein 1 n=1 Tax=Sesamum alatum TaxID=300844 RepID=A0AAE1YSX6_9LAMI|nr:Acyl-CoA-binding domain-containing protein 1 [Sesamum alatum]
MEEGHQKPFGVRENMKWKCTKTTKKKKKDSKIPQLYITACKNSLYDTLKTPSHIRIPCQISQPSETRSKTEFKKMGLKEEFEQNASKAWTLPQNTSNEDLLILYGQYKQATVGNINKSRPGMFKQRERAKWDAWNAAKGKSRDEAMREYNTKVEQLLKEAGCPK